jgi:hypothetical protein
MAWEWRENNREKVLESLQKGEYEAILTSRDCALDALAQLSSELGVFEAVELIKVDRERAGVPDELALQTLAVLPFIEAMNLSAAANTLFRRCRGITAVGVYGSAAPGGVQPTAREGPGNEISTLPAVSSGCIA